MQPKIELVKTRDFGEIINDTFTFVAQNWKPLLKSYVIIGGFFVIAHLVVLLLQQKNIIGTAETNSSASTVYFRQFAAMLNITYLLRLIFGLLNLTAIILVPLCFMSLYKEKGNVAPETEEVWAYLKYYFFKILGSYVLIGVCFVIAFVLCIVPFFYFLPILILILPIMVMENAGFSYSWSKSFQLIKENWWQTFGAIVIIWIIAYAATLIFIVPVSLLSVGTMFISKSHSGSAAIMLISIISALCQVFLMLPSITATLCYFNLNEQKEGTGLMNRINNFGTNNLDTGLPEEEY